MIQDLAERCADKVDDGQRTARQCAIKAYVKGYADGSGVSGKKAGDEEGHRRVWHPVTELPPVRSVNLYCLTGQKGNVQKCVYEDEESFKTYVSQNGIRMWAYRHDLLEA